MHYREDLLLAGVAKGLGFEINMQGDEQNLDSDGYLKTYQHEGQEHLYVRGNCWSFSKTGKTIWFVGDAWVCADISDGSGNLCRGVASNHRRYIRLKEALEAEVE